MSKDIEYKEFVRQALSPYVYFIEFGNLDLAAFKKYSPEQVQKVMENTSVLNKLAVRERQLVKPIIPYKQKYAVRQFSRRRGRQVPAKLTVKGDTVTKYRLLKSGNISVRLAQQYEGKNAIYQWNEAAHIYKPDSPGYNKALSRLHSRRVGAKSRIERKYNVGVNFVSLMQDADARKEFGYKETKMKTYKSGRNQYTRAMNRPPHLRDTAQYYVNNGKIVASYSVQKAPDDKFIEGTTNPYAGYVYYRTRVEHETEYNELGTARWLDVFFSGGKKFVREGWNDNAVAYSKKTYPVYMEYAKKLFLEKLKKK